MNEIIRIENIEGDLRVSSRLIAEHFEKQHKHVIEKIESIKVENSAVTKMFTESTYVAGTGKAYKEYLISRDGFTLLAMGFTGKKALDWKLKYIDAFNRMEEELRNNNKYQYENLSTEMKALLMHDKKIQAVQKEVLEVKEDIRYVKAIAEKSTIDYEQQENIRELVNLRGTEILGGKTAPAYKSMSKKIFQSLWRDYKKYFKVNSYKNTAIKDYENAIRYIQNWHPKYDTVLDINMINRQVVFA